MSTLAIGAKIAGTGLSAFSSLVQAEAISRNEMFNSDMALQEANLTRDLGERNAEIQEKSDRAFIGSQIAKTGASGVKVDRGSPLIAQAQNEMVLETNKQAILFDSEARARNLENEAAIRKVSAKSAKVAGFLGAANSVLSGGGNTLLTSNRLRQSGSLGGNFSLLGKIRSAQKRRFS